MASSQLTDGDWRSLLRRIRDGRCTPFLGAGASHPPLPLGSTVAKAWADKYGYPMDDREDLVRVAQYLAVQNDLMFPKEEFLDQYLRDVEPPDFSQADNLFGLLADLPLPIYMTTNYDDFMVQALDSRGKSPKRELCRWNERLRLLSEDEEFEPTQDHPIVFHLHGHDAVPESLVIAEEDYLNFLVSVSREPDLVPARIRQALAGTTLLFVGYGLEDWSFRVVFQGVLQSTTSSLRRISITVQLPPDDSVSRHRAQAYLDRYYSKMDIRVYWGTAKEFATELRRRWEASIHG